MRRTESLRGVWRLSLALSMLTAAAAPAAVFVVDRQSDAVDQVPGDGTCEAIGGGCSLRAAVLEANALVGPDTIMLPAGVHALTLAGAAEDAGASGDVDVTDDLTISGAGRDVSIIDGGGGDRVLHVQAGVVAIQGVTVRNGAVPSAIDPPIGRGGGVLNEGMLTLAACRFVENFAEEYGGGVDNGLPPPLASSTLVVDDCVFERNEAPHGAGIYNVGTVEVHGSEFRDHASPSAGGSGVENAGAASITTSLFIGNSADGGAGGAIANYSEFFGPDPVLHLDRCLLDGNRAGAGGALYNEGAVTVVASTLRGNTVTGTGGAIEMNGGTLSMVNSTMTGNAVLSGGGSGNALGVDDGDVQLSNVTVSGNGGATGSSAVAVRSTGQGTVAVRNSILAGNLGADCSGNVSSAGHNVLNTCTPSDVGPTDRVGSFNVALAAADNGGPTPTNALFLGSVAIDAGDPAGCADHLGNPISTDQRGVSRPQGQWCDAGSYEYEGLCPAGAAMTDVVLDVKRLGAPLGDEQLRLRGRLELPAGQPPDFDPPVTGAQVAVFDVLGVGPLFALTADTAPIPPHGEAGACDERDGWRATTYRNASGALPPACAAGSANGLRRFRLRDRRGRKGTIDFWLRSRNAVIPSPTSGLFGIAVVLGAAPTADDAGACGAHLFLGTCTLSDARLRCRE